MEGYQQLFALTKNPKYVKMRPPGKTGRPSKLNNTANAGRIVRGRNGGKILPAFLLTILSRHLPSPRYRRKRKRAEVASAQVKKRSFVKAVEMARHDSHQGRGKLPPCMPQSECGAGHTGYRASPDPSPGGSQDTGGAFRSRVQRPGVRHRSTGAGHIAPCGSVLTQHK